MTRTRPGEPVEEHDPVARDSRRWTELGWGDPTAMAAFMSVLRTHKQIVDRAHATLAELSLSITDYATLVYLGLSPDRQQSLGKVAERLLIGAGRCSYVIDNLQTAGYVERRPHPTDRRTTLAVLTDAGLACLHTANDRLQGTSFGFGPIDAGSLEALTDDLRTIRLGIGDVDDAGFIEAGAATGE